MQKQKPTKKSQNGEIKKLKEEIRILRTRLKYQEREEQNLKSQDNTHKGKETQPKPTSQLILFDDTFIKKELLKIFVLSMISFSIITVLRIANF